MVYPLIVFTLTAVIGIGIAWFIFPRLATVFATLRVDLPLVTRILIKLGAFLGSYGMVVIPLFACLVVAVCYILFFYARTRFLGEEILLRMPGVGRLLREIELARFGYLLRTLLDAGISLTETLSITAQSSTLTSFQEFYAFLHDRVDEGHSFGRSFAMHPSPSRFIPLPLQQMIISAEQSGHLSETFKIIQDMYEEKVEVTSKNVAVVFEPLLLVIVWFGVLAVALAVILPIYSLIGGLTDR
jgi:type II secretory pathway component PulF